MADLIININFDESQKKQRLVIEFFEGVIPHLKSKKFSGQLRSVNLSSVIHVDNLNSTVLNNIKNVFNDEINTQISKNQYVFSVRRLPYLQTLIDSGCVFCKESRNSPMYKIERLILNTEHHNMKSIHDFSFFQDKTFLYINYDTTVMEDIHNDLVALFYINISSSSYHSELYFDYGNDIVKADDKEIFIEHKMSYRNYRLEHEIINHIKNHNWKNAGNNSFLYTGEDISCDMQALEQFGIRLYTNTQKIINVAKISNVSVSYGIDWFELDGNVNAGNQEMNLSDLIDFQKKEENWIEYNDRIIFIYSLSAKGTKEL